VALFRCASCGFERSVPDKLIGREAKCPRCGGVGHVTADGPAPGRAPEHAQAQTHAHAEAQTQDPGVAIDAAVASALAAAREPLSGAAAPSAPSPAAPVPPPAADAAPARGVVRCRMCGYRAEVPGRLVGKAARCPQCAKAVTVEPLLDTPPDITDIDLDDLEETIRPVHQSAPETRRTADPVDLTLEDPREVARRPGLFSGNLPRNVLAGLVGGLVATVFSMAYAALVFQASPLARLVPHGTAMALVSSCLGGLIIARMSRVPFAVGGAELAGSVMLVLLAGDIQNRMAATAAPEAIAATVLAAIAVATFCTGAVVFFVGRFKDGDWVRYIPYPVVAGLMGGLGLIILGKAWLLVTGQPFTWATLAGLLSPAHLRELLAPERTAELLRFSSWSRWLPPVVMGAALFLVLRPFRNSLLLLFLLVFGTGTFYALLRHASVSMDQAAAAGLFLSGFDTLAEARTVFDTGFLALVRWDVIYAHAHYVLALAAMTVSLTMLKVTHLEVIMGRELDLDAEFRVIGAAGTACALAGGMPVTLSLGKSRGNHDMGADGPLAGVVGALVCGAALLFLGRVLPWVPAFVPTAVLVYFGLSLVVRWVFNSRRELTHTEDYLLLLCIFALTAVLGVLVGLSVGAALALMVMISRYGRVPVVKHMLSGKNHRSNVDRGPDQIAVLDEVGESVFILRLQGFIFLGTTHGLLRIIRRRMEHRDLMPVRYIILDFTLVSGLDSTVAITFTKLQQLAWSQSVILIFTNVPFELEEQLARGGFVLNDPDKGSVTFVNLDYAMEWCENLLLEEEDALEERARSMEDILKPVFPAPGLLRELIRRLERVTVDKGRPVFRQGDPSDSMYFVESGQVNVELNVGRNKILRLKKMGYGTVFGEMGLYTDAPRSAGVTAAENCVLYRLSNTALEAIRIELPELYSAVNRLVVNLLAKRVAEANVRVRDLSR
jgi:SulP family sulfate permease